MFLRKNRRNQAGLLLHAAVLSGDITRVLNVLETANIDINQQDNKGNTPLHVAYKKGFEEIKNLLITKGARTDILNKANKKASECQRSSGPGFLDQLMPVAVYGGPPVERENPFRDLSEVPDFGPTRFT